MNPLSSLNKAMKSSNHLYAEIISFNAEPISPYEVKLEWQVNTESSNVYFKIFFG